MIFIARIELHICASHVLRMLCPNTSVPTPPTRSIQLSALLANFHSRELSSIEFVGLSRSLLVH